MRSCQPLRTYIHIIVEICIRGPPILLRHQAAHRTKQRAIVRHGLEAQVAEVIVRVVAIQMIVPIGIRASMHQKFWRARESPHKDRCACILNFNSTPLPQSRQLLRYGLLMSPTPQRIRRSKHREASRKQPKTNNNTSAVSISTARISALSQPRWSRSPPTESPGTLERSKYRCRWHARKRGRPNAPKVCRILPGKFSTSPSKEVGTRGQDSIQATLCLHAVVS